MSAIPPFDGDRDRPAMRRRMILALSLTTLSACAASPRQADDSLGREGGASPSRPSLVLHERDIAVEQPGPHEGGGVTTAYPFFADAEGLELVFRKRVLHPGSSIGLHPHDHDEIYYVLEGEGVYTLDGGEHVVGPGNAMLVRAGSTHGIRPGGAEDLVLLIMYREAE